MVRILGSTGTRRRRRYQLAALLSVVALLALIAVPNAFAVHDVGVFQLDGNAEASDPTNNPTPTPTDDWDLVCHQVTVTNDLADGDTSVPPDGNANDIPDQCTSVGNTSGATAVSWTEELNRNASIFTGGGSKDPIDISSWAWKDGAGGLPDKDNLLHAFAARYDIPSTGTTGTCPDSIAPCDGIYFGSDRLDNSGDAQEGFWFLQNKCGLGTTKSGGGTNFDCTDPTPGTDPTDDFHREGDLLVLSDFSNGGGTSTINIWKWVNSCTGTCSGSHLKFLTGGTGVKCDPALSGDDFCGIVNPADQSPTTAPWTFTDKSGNSTYLNGEFYEGGVNLSSPQINLAGECFATLVSETRSSTSPTATLKDFVLGQFAVCRAGMTTEPVKTSDGTSVRGGSVPPGTAVHDVATVTGNQPSKTPSGEVTFFLCSFAVGSSDTCDGSAGHVGTQLTNVPPQGTLVGSGTTATASSPDVNGSTPLGPGHYCFRAEWPGDINYTDALSFDGSDECFNVTVIPTEIKTVQFFYPNDTATIQTSDGTSDLPDGFVTFRLYGPTTGNTALVNCTNNTGTAAGGLLYSTSVAVGAGTATSDSASTANTTKAIPTDTTSLYWRVSYTIVPANPSFAPSSSVCVENTSYTVGSGDTDTATIVNDKTFHS